MIDRSFAVDELTRSQHGLITTQQAIDALGPSRKARWVAQRRLISVQPGVFRMSGAPETWHEQLMGVVLATDGIVSHRSAAELWGLIQPAGYLEVSVKPSSNRTIRPPAIVHRIADLRPGLAIMREGLPVTDAVRTVIDLGLVMPWWLVERAIAKGIASEALSIAEVRALGDALGRPGRNGTGIVRAILDGTLVVLGRDESELERRFSLLTREHGLPTFVLQHEVWAAGRFVGRINAAIPELKLAIEVDGFEHHSTPDGLQHHRTRQNHFVALGWTVLCFTWHDVVHEPANVARTIEQAIARLSAA